MEEVPETRFVFIVTDENAALVFKRVAEGYMGHVMKQRSDADQLHFIRGNGLLAPEHLQNPVGHP